MPYEIKPMPFDPKSISGISEKVLVSHYENNYGGAVSASMRSPLNSRSSTSPRRRTSSSTA